MMIEIQDRLHGLGWDVACVNSNQPDGGIVGHFVPTRGNQDIRVDGPDVFDYLGFDLVRL